MQMNLIIPMVGQGKRFREAGYDVFKPFISIKGRPMIKYVTDAFPPSVRKHIITNRSLLTAEQEKYLKEDLQCHIIDIPLHECGPAYSIYQARKELPLDESFFISYCDIYWDWNFDAVTSQLACDGMIFTHSGFHPHLLGNNHSAFCLPSAEDPLRLREIREKGSYTDDWMLEPLSIGVFYLRNGHDMLAGISDLIERKVSVQGEYFPSLLFNYLVKQNKNIYLEQLDFFIHWGVPEHLEDYMRWDAIIAGEVCSHPLHDPDFPENIVTMAGSGKRMVTFSEQPKALIPVGTVPMFQHVLNHFPSRSVTLIITREIAVIPAVRDCGVELFVLDQVTGSQYATLLEAEKLLCSRMDYFLTSCDAYGLFDHRAFRAFTLNRRPDAIIFTFKPSLIQKKMSQHHSHVSTSGDKVTALYVKTMGGDNTLGLAGFFWVRDGAVFRQLHDVAPLEPGEMYADHIFRHFIEGGMDIGFFCLDQYVHLGTPEELLEYAYWSSRAYLFKDKEDQASKGDNA